MGKKMKTISGRQLDVMRERFWTSLSANDSLHLESPAALWNFLQGRLESLGPWKLGYKLEGDKKSRNQRVFFRGQADIAYGLTTSLYREIRTYHLSNPVTENVLQQAEAALLQEARNQGLGRGMTDGQLLMIMQHHGAPTRLLDVSLGPFEALYFAVESAEDRPGMLFIIHTQAASPKFGELHATQELPWHAEGSETHWRSGVFPVKHLSLDSRMHAQRGAFLAGGLADAFDEANPRRNDQRVVNRVFAVPMLIDHSNFPIEWRFSNDESLLRRINRPVGWAIKIPADWKRVLREMLSKQGITRDSLYPPVNEISRLAKYLTRNPPGGSWGDSMQHGPAGFPFTH